MEQNSRLYNLFLRLRRRRFLIGIEDYFALREAMKSGLGWSSRESLRNLCCLLWAKSNSERQILETLFDQLGFPAWDLTPVTHNTSDESESIRDQPREDNIPQGTTSEAATPVAEIGAEVPATHSKEGLPPIDLQGLDLGNKHFVFIPHLPLMPREVLPLWNQFRTPELSGPPEEIDIEATISLRCRQGISGPIILRPRRRKAARVVLFVDRQGSMAPFHRLVDMICETTKNSARSVAVYYFHDVPAEGADDKVLMSIAHQPFPGLDDVLDQVLPLESGFVYEDEKLLSPVPLSILLSRFPKGASVIFMSDAGAARRRYDLQRLLDTVAFVKALMSHTRRYIWLNPLPSAFWKGTTAEQIARHVPMFVLDREGLKKAVHLNWSRTSLENPL